MPSPENMLTLGATHPRANMLSEKFDAVATVEAEGPDILRHDGSPYTDHQRERISARMCESRRSGQPTVRRA